MANPSVTLRQLAEAATPGPWRWFGQRTHGMFLGTRGGGRRFVMGFRRQGMRGAQPEFQVYDKREGDLWEWSGRIVPASELAILEAPYREDISGIDHPDARLIALAPALAVWAADAAEWIQHVDDEALRDREPDYDRMHALLARLGDLVGQEPTA